MNKTISIGNRIVFCDEVIFTSKELDEKAYCKANEKIFAPEKRGIETFYKAIVGASAQVGIEGYKIYAGSVNSEKFLDAITDFDLNGTNYTLFGDNASWHISKALHGEVQIA